MQSLDTTQRFGRLARARRRALGIRLVNDSGGGSGGGKDHTLPELPGDTKGTGAGGP